MHAARARLRLGHGLCAALFLLAGCAVQPEGPPSVSLRPVEYSTLPGWDADPVSTMLPALLRQCRRLALLPADADLGGSGGAAAVGGKAADWTPFCRAVQWVRPGDDAALKQVIVAWLQPYEVGDRGREEARFTGYFEPEYPGALSPDATYRVPVYRRPPDLLTVHGPPPSGGLVSGRAVDGHVVPYWTRAQIDKGILAGHGLEIVWLADPVDLFFMQLQGSARVRLPSGQIVRLGYAGRNGAPYVPLGRLLVQQGELAPDAVSMQRVRAWLAAHPDRAQALMEQNPNYVFFRLLDDLRPDQGPVGALGVDLQPLRSVAIDRSYLPLAAPVWADTTEANGQPLRRLMLAQDLGTDINGPARADIFFGWGAAAGRDAGTMHAGGHLVVLLPRPPRR
jgi:peptidoglycan lytic transglycosylase A